MKIKHILLILTLALTTFGAAANAQDPYFLRAAKGEVPGLSGTAVIGSNEALGAVEETIWMAGGKYVYPTTGLRMSVVSDDYADALGGAGVEKIRITYLTSDFTELTEEVTLAGLTPVLTDATDIYRINMVESIQSANGANTAFNVGNIDVYSGAVSYAYVEVGESIDLTTVYTIPKDKIGYLYSMCGSTDSGKSVTFSLVMHEVNQPPHVHGHLELYQAAACRVYDIPLRVGEGADIEVRGVSSAAGTHVEATYNLFLVDR